LALTKLLTKLSADEKSENLKAIFLVTPTTRINVIAAASSLTSIQCTSSKRNPSSNCGEDAQPPSRSYIQTEICQTKSSHSTMANGSNKEQSQYTENKIFAPDEKAKFMSYKSNCPLKVSLTQTTPYKQKNQHPQ
jgi:hypothetical protein